MPMGMPIGINPFNKNDNNNNKQIEKQWKWLIWFDLKKCIGVCCNMWLSNLSCLSKTHSQNILWINLDHIWISNYTHVLLNLGIIFLVHTSRVNSIRTLAIAFGRYWSTTLFRNFWCVIKWSYLVVNMITAG